MGQPKEDFPFNAREGFDAAAATCRFLVIDADARPDAWSLFGFCELFANSPRDGRLDAVTSEVPALAMAATKRIRTDPSAATMVSRTLTNPQALLFPEPERGVIIRSQCAGDFAEAFIKHPGEPTNTVCTETLEPEFHIPPAAKRGRRLHDGRADFAPPRSDRRNK